MAERASRELHRRAPRGAMQALRRSAAAVRQRRTPAPPQAPPPPDYEQLAVALRPVVQEVVDQALERTYQREFTMPHLLAVQAAAESARFVTDNVPLHLGKSHYDLRRDAVMAAPADGLFLEFGVWKGMWLRQMAAVRDVSFYGFDSFEGLPEPWSIYGEGFFDLEGQLPEMPDNVELVKGWFDESVPEFLERHPEPVSFIHVDCDLYTSTKTVLELLAPRLRAGAQIVLDDFMLQPGWQDEEHRAFFEFIASSGWSYSYTGYSTDFPSCSAAVVLTARPA